LRALIIALLLVVSPLVAHAAAADEDAKRHSEAAHSAFATSDYARAIEEFKKSYELKPDPRLFYNLGLAHMKRWELKKSREDRVQARDYFKRFLLLVDPNAKPYAEDKPRLIKIRALAEEYLAAIKDAPDEPPPPTIAEKKPEPDFAPPPVRIEPEPEHSAAPAIIFGVAGAFAAGALITGGIAVRWSDTAHQHLRDGDYETADARASGARAMAAIADGLTAAAVAGAAIALYLHLQGSDADVHAAISPSGAVVTVRY
jgi:tetratricopeptide (TPR) repeat protein